MLVTGIEFFISLFQYSFGSYIPWVISRDCIILYTLEYLSSEKKNFSDKKIIEKFYGQFMGDLVISSVVEWLLSYFIYGKFAGLNPEFNFPDLSNFSLLKFIFISFLFELIFDFFHYTTHRFAHSNKFAYEWHKEHHEHANLKGIITFHQSVVDLICTNAIPFILTHKIVSSFYEISDFTLALISVYKVYTEICGHLGKKSDTSSFPQCIFIPRMLNIAIYSKDHYNHHVYLNCNYSKRFSIWDKLFGTYDSIH